MSDRPHSILIEHVRLRDTHGWIGIRPGCVECAERYGADYADGSTRRGMAEDELAKVRQRRTLDS